MIVDFVLDVFFAVPAWVIGLMPDGVESTWFPGFTGSSIVWFQRIWATAAYFLPLDYLLELVGWGIAVWFAVGLIKWVLRFIPGMGGG